MMHYEFLVGGIRDNVYAHGKLAGAVFQHSQQDLQIPGLVYVVSTAEPKPPLLPCTVSPNQCVKHRILLSDPVGVCRLVIASIACPERSSTWGHSSSGCLGQSEIYNSLVNPEGGLEVLPVMNLDLSARLCRVCWKALDVATAFSMNIARYLADRA